MNKIKDKHLIKSINLLFLIRGVPSIKKIMNYITLSL